MRSAADLASELDEGLRELFQAGLALSLEVQRNAMAAEPAEQARLGLTFHRLSRGVRQTAALRMKLARDAEHAGRETAAEVIDLAKARVKTRRAQVQATIDRLIWTERETCDSDDLRSELDDLLDIEVQDAETFESEDVGEQIARLCKLIGFTPPTLKTVIPRSGGTPDPGDPSGVANPEPQLGSPASPCGRAEDDAGGDEDPILSDDYWRSSA